MDHILTVGTPSDTGHRSSVHRDTWQLLLATHAYRNCSSVFAREHIHGGAPQLDTVSGQHVLLSDVPADYATLCAAKLQRKLPLVLQNSHTTRTHTHTYTLTLLLFAQTNSDLTSDTSTTFQPFQPSTALWQTFQLLRPPFLLFVTWFGGATQSSSNLAATTWLFFDL